MTTCPQCGYENPDGAKFCVECAARLESGQDPFIGAIIDKRYEVLEKIAEGGMGTVYRAHHVRIDTEIAMKILHPELARDREFLARFEKEAKTIAMLNHRNIVRVQDTGPVRDTCFIVMDYVKGESLIDMIKRRGKLPTDEAFAIASQVAEGLAYAHERNVLHRDIKPANIIVAESGKAIITDFGIAKAVGEKGQTKTGTSIGTPEYMSLEQVKGKELDGRTDVYSLGVVLYEMLTGKSPFRSESGVSTIANVLSEAPEPIERLASDIPGWAVEVVKKTIAKDKGERYGSAVDFLNAVRKETGQKPLPVSAAPPPKKTIKVEKPPPREKPPKPKSGPFVLTPEKKRQAIIAILVALIIIGIIATVMLAIVSVDNRTPVIYGEKQPSPPPPSEPAYPAEKKPVEVESKPPPAPKVEYGYITGNRVNVRDGPGVNNSIVTKLNKGDRVSIIDKRITGSDSEGRLWNVTKIYLEGGGTKRLNKGHAVTILGESGSNYRVKFKVTNATKTYYGHVNKGAVKVFKGDYWYKVRTSGGSVGWVIDDYVRISG